MSARIIALHDSPESLNAAIERLAYPGAGCPDHNVGSCGCAMGRQVAGPAGIPMSPGAAAAARTLAARFGGVDRILAALRSMGVAPANIDTANLASALNADRGAQPLPYEDAIQDCMFMDTLVSAETVVPALATTVDVTINASQGWFFAYYIDVSVIRPADGGTCIDPCVFTMTQPLVDGCPPPACQGGNPQRNAAFYVRRDTASGCGRPFQAVIPSAAQGAPLRVSFARLQAADIVQVQLRGFCFDTRICC